MSQWADQVQGRRVSWDGVAVRDLSWPGVNPYCGQCFRVSHSGRDPQSGNWHINWDVNRDRLPARPVGEPIYKFDGSTWDLPAYAATAVPWGTAAFSAVLLIVGMIGVGNEVGGAGVLLWSFAWAVACGPWLYAAWMLKIEPVRGTRVMAAVIAWSRYRSQQNQTESSRLTDEFNRSSGILNYLREMDPDEARRYGATPEDLR